MTVHGDANAFLTLFHAEGTGKRDFISKSMLRDAFLQVFHNLPGTFEMAGGSDTNGDFHIINHAKGGMRMVASFPEWMMKWTNRAPIFSRKAQK